MLKSHKRVSARISSIAALVLAAAPIATTTVHAENAPEYNGVFKERDPVTGAYMALEKIHPVRKIEKHLMFIRGSEGYYEFPGSHSPVRFHVGQQIEFIVYEQQTDTGNDPNRMMEFFTLQSTADTRRLVIVSFNGVLGSKDGNKTMYDSMVQYTATKFGAHYYKVVPKQPLPPGEYTMSGPGDPNGYSFGIDP